jgi:hypothetical protein
MTFPTWDPRMLCKLLMKFHDIITPFGIEINDTGNRQRQRQTTTVLLQKKSTYGPVHSRCARGALEVRCWCALESLHYSGVRFVRAVQCGPVRFGAVSWRRRALMLAVCTHARSEGAPTFVTRTFQLLCVRSSRFLCTRMSLRHRQSPCQESGVPG